MGGGGGGAGNIAKAAVGGGAGSALGTVAMGPTGALIGGQAGAGALGGGNVNLGPLGGILGQNGGAGGTGFKGPEAANIQQGTSVQDVQNAQKNVNNSLESQNKLLSALQGQNGLGQQSALASQLQAANGVGTQNRAISGLGGAADMYGNIAQGRGPNPAQAMLNQQTGANVANQAALMAGQRGAGANVGLMARQAAQQGAATQQQAVGQGATMQANQQLGALQGLVGANSAMAGVGGQQVGAQQAMANQMAGQQIGQVNANAQAQMGNAGQLQNSLGGYNNAIVSNQNNINAGNAGLAQTQMQGQQKIVGGIMGGAGTAMGLPMATGGEVHHYAAGDMVYQQPQGATSPFGQFLNQVNQPAPIANDPGMFSLAQQPDEPKNGKKEKKEAPAPAVEAPVEPPANPSPMVAQQTSPQMNSVPMQPASVNYASGGLASQGGHVKADAPEEKAEKSGNSYDNDKIDAKLSEGEIVLPRSVTMSSDPLAASMEFIKQTLAKRNKPVQKFAEGDEVVDPAQEFMAPPNQVPMGTEEPKAAPPPAPQAPVAPGAVASAPPTTPPQAPEASAPPEEQAPAPIVTPAEKAAQQAQKMTNDQMQFADDLKYGKVAPKTYHDLYESKSTLGKLGTIFGLLVSGAGSGLTGQPNALMDMMNKEIERDFEAQKTNQSNKQTWYKSALDHNRLESENALRGAQTDIAHNEAAKSAWENQQAGIVDADGLNNSSSGVIHTYQSMTDRLPAGPIKDQMQAMIDNKLIPYFIQKGIERNVGAAQKKELLGTIPSTAPKNVGYAPGANPKTGEADPTKRLDTVNEKAFNAAVQKGKFAENAPDAIPPALLPVVNEEKKKLEQNRDNWKDVAATFKALKNLKNAGQAPGVSNASNALAALAAGAGTVFGGPLGGAIAGTLGKLATAVPGETLKNYFERNRDILVKSLMERIGGNKSDEAKRAQIESLLPSWADDDKSIKSAWENMNTHFAHNEEEKAPNLRRLNMVYNSPKYSFEDKKPETKESPKKKEMKEEKPKTTGSSGDW